MVGYLASKVVPGKPTAFYMEIPPLRLPKASNVATKTLSRMQWYLVEVIPIFLVASVLLWLGDMTGVFDALLRGLEPLVEAIGLTTESAVAFLYGFFRRDFGAAGLYDLHSEGVLVGAQLLVAAVTLTLFVPCVAQFLVMIKERGVRVALSIAVFTFVLAFFVGFALDRILGILGVSL
jgi:ferrous iron transport protein B